MGKRVGSCGNLIRLILGLFSILFLLIGIALVVLTSLIKWSDILTKVINTNNLKALNIASIDAITIALLCVGAFIIVLSLIGLFGVIFLNKCLLIFYEIACLIIFLAHAGAFIAYFVYEPRLQNEIEKSFNNSITTNTSSQILLAVAYAFNCCGSTGPSDFVSNQSKLLYCGSVTSTQGCANATYSFIKQYSVYGIIIPTSILLFIELVILIGVPFLVIRMNRSYD